MPKLRSKSPKLRLKSPKLRSKLPKLRSNFAKTQFNFSKTQILRHIGGVRCRGRVYKNRPWYYYSFSLQCIDAGRQEGAEVMQSKQQQPKPAKSEPIPKPPRKSKLPEPEFVSKSVTRTKSQPLQPERERASSVPKPSPPSLTSKNFKVQLYLLILM